jgi:hypothetical protein
MSMPSIAHAAGGISVDPLSPFSKTIDCTSGSSTPLALATELNSGRMPVLIPSERPTPFCPLA